MDGRAIGHCVWAIPEGYIPPTSNGPAPEMISHEALCLLNASRQDANVELTVYFEDSEPVGPFRFTVQAERTLHLRFNNLRRASADPEGHQLFFGSSVRRPHRRTAHASRLTPGRECTAVHDRIPSARLAVRDTFEAIDDPAKKEMKHERNGQ